MDGNDARKLIEDLDRFDDVWLTLEETAECDSLGGMEYRRVRAEWIEAGRPAAIALDAFIRTRANVVPAHD